MTGRHGKLAELLRRWGESMSIRAAEEAPRSRVTAVLQRQECGPRWPDLRCCHGCICAVGGLHEAGRVRPDRPSRWKRSPARENGMVGPRRRRVGLDRWGPVVVVVSPSRCRGDGWCSRSGRPPRRGQTPPDFCLSAWIATAGETGAVRGIPAAVRGAGGMDCGDRGSSPDRGRAGRAAPAAPPAQRLAVRLAVRLVVARDASDGNPLSRVVRGCDFVQPAVGVFGGRPAGRWHVTLWIMCCPTG